ncbi:hypothetical protein F66182_2540 [Fusarium sp. NRRL 66182]|nr:hypothetical protein F66182_2540 [Fusarium sp. NRRL 66182]
MAGLQPDIWASVVITWVAALMSLVMRVCARRITKVSWWFDDYFTILAFVFATGYCGIMLEWTTHTYLGVMMPDSMPVEEREAILQQSRFLGFFNSLCYASSIACSKIAILSLYWRLFKTSSIRIPILVMLVMVVIWIFLRTFMLIFRCVPTQSIWDLTITDKVCNINSGQFFLGTITTHFLMDIAILILPVIEVFRLRLRAGQKLAIAALFLIGAIVCVASMFVLVELVTYPNDTTQMPYEYAMFCILGSVEVNIAIVSACFPLLRPIFVHILPTRFLSSYGRSSQRPSRPSRPSNAIKLTTIIRTNKQKDSDETSSMHQLADPEHGICFDSVDIRRPEGVHTVISSHQSATGHDQDLYFHKLRSIQLDGIDCMLDILDTAGQEEYTALRDQWIRDGEAIVLVYSISSRPSFTRVKRFHDQIQRVRGKPTPICLVGNKSDRVTERQVSTTEGFELALSLGIEFFVECSAKNAFNVEKTFYDLVRSLRAQQGGAGLYERKQTLLGSQLIIPAGESETYSGRDRLARSLVHAARTNNLKDVFELLDAGADVNAQPSTSGSALHEAAGLGYLTMVNLLLKKGAGINARSPSGVSPLQDAAAGGHLDVVKSLIQQGANRDQVSGVRGTALHAAASRGHAKVVKYILKQGASPNQQAGPYEYALHAGSWFGSPGVVNALLDEGAEIGQLTEEGCTALHMAAFAGNVQVLQSLINRGGRLYMNVVSAKFGTALDAADNSGHFAAVQILRDEKAEKSGLVLSKRNNKPNLPARQELDTQAGSSDSNGQDEEVDDDDDDDGDNQQIPEQNRTSVLSNNMPSEVVLTSEFDFGFSRTPKTPLPPKPPIQDMGFTTLHNPPQARADIVFVHGLQGHPEKTWTFKNEAERVPLTWRERLLRQRRRQRAVGATVYWPYDLLCVHDEFASSRVMTWGYDTKVLREFFKGNDSQNISQHGNNFLVRLQQERRDNPTRPLIFVAHSLGGIIVKAALAISKNSQHQPQYLPIYSSILGIIFLATPHNGSGTAGWGLIASNLAKVALQRPSRSVLRGLKPNSEVLENLQRTFLQMLEDGHFAIHSFWETVPMTGIKGLKGLSATRRRRYVWG